MSSNLTRSNTRLVPMLYNVSAVLLILIIASWHSTSTAANYQQPEEFIRQAFADNPPSPKKIWIKKQLKQDIKKILGHNLGVLRLQYWKQDNRSAWILEEIGKERLITAGIVVNQQQIEQIKVLAFREIRGWEIRYPFFADQFTGITLKSDHRLSKHIDGISGATLSVKAMKKMARLALLLDQKTTRFIKH